MTRPLRRWTDEVRLWTIRHAVGRFVLDVHGETARPGHPRTCSALSADRQSPAGLRHGYRALDRVYFRRILHATAPRPKRWLSRNLAASSLTARAGGAAPGPIRYQAPADDELKDTAAPAKGAAIAASRNEFGVLQGPILLPTGISAAQRCCRHWADTKTVAAPAAAGRASPARADRRP